MAIRMSKNNLSSSKESKIKKECTFFEELSFMQRKYNKKPIERNFIKNKKTELIVPFYTALNNGYSFQKIKKFPWYLIQPLEEPKNFKNVYDLDKSHKGFRNFVGEFRYYQKQCILDLLKQLDDNSCTTLCLPPGWGKTMAGSYCAWRLGFRILTFISIESLLNGWLKTFKNFLPNFKIWVVDKKTECPEDVDIILCMDKRFKYIPKHILKTIGTFIADEIHLLCSETRMEIFLKIFPRYVIFLSATLIKQNGMHKLSFLMAGLHGVFKLTTRPYNVYLVDTFTDGDEVIINDCINSSKMRKSLVSNNFRQKILLYILMNNSNYNKFISLRMVKDLIEEFKEMIIDCGMTSDTFFGSKKKIKNCQVTVGTQQKMGTGYDEENACKDYDKDKLKTNILIFENTTANHNIIYQGMGRAMRVLGKKDENTKIDEKNKNNYREPAIIFLLHNNDNCKKHINDAIPFLKKTNANIIRINYWELILPKDQKIYKRKYSKSSFYRFVSDDAFEDYENFHILPQDDKDLKYAEISGKRNLMIIYKDKKELRKKYKGKSGYIFKVKKINSGFIKIKKKKIQVCISPICDFNVCKIENL